MNVAKYDLAITTMTKKVKITSGLPYSIPENMPSSLPGTLDNWTGPSGRRRNVEISYAFRIIQEMWPWMRVLISTLMTLILIL